MTLTVLIDLDNTLLSNDMKVFEPAYLQLLSRHLHYLPPETTIKYLLKATQAMAQKSMPALTLEQVFDKVFYPGIGLSKQALWEDIQEFYVKEFPKLRSITKPICAAKELVETAFAHKHQVVIASNPLFPETAILQRLKWAELDPGQFPFTLITSYENFHFTKSTPAFYAEILAQLGWTEQPAVMIGDSLDHDVIPASLFNLPVFWLTEPAQPLPDIAHPLSGVGTLKDANDWLLKIENFKIEPPNPSINSLIITLKSTPAALEAMGAKLDQAYWNFPPQKDEWSLTEILCHLRDLEREVNIQRLRKVIGEDNPFFPGVVSDPWAKERRYIQQNGLQSFQQFLNARTESLEFLLNLPENSWEKPARHAIFGPTRFKELVSFITQHDRTHVHQAAEAINQINSLI